MNLQQAMLAAQLAHAKAAAAQDLIDDVDRILRPVGIRLYRWAPAGPGSAAWSVRAPAKNRLP